jgi:proline dehydrogenase
VVIQAYLYRSKTDLDELCTQKTRVRLCKGAYKEPARVAFPIKDDVDHNYDLLARHLLEQARSDGVLGSPDGLVPPLPAFATHDERRIASIKAWLQDNPLPSGAVEFQMLYGIRRDLQAALVREGYPVRVYVPFGSHWYPYLMRRMAERPANLWFFVKNFFKA